MARMTESETSGHIERDFQQRLIAATPRVLVTPALVAINLCAFAAMTVLGVSALGGRAEEYLRFGANFGPLTTGGEWWRLVTCTFVHFGIIHLAFNLWALWDGGGITERLFGNLRFAAIYFFAGVAGSCASLLWNPQAVSAGASGAIFGVYGALLAYMTAQRGSIPPKTLNRLRISTSTFVVYSLFYGFAQTGIDNAAHLGGLAGGFAMGLILARPLNLAARGTHDTLRVWLAALLAAIVLPSAAWLAPDTSRVYRQAIALQKEIEYFSAEESRLQAMFRELVERNRSGALGNAAVLGRIRGELLPAWNSAVDRLAQVELDPKAPSRPDYELLLRYATTRRNLMAAIADYMESNNPALERRIATLRHDAEDDLKQYRERQKK
jgi:rhomboid protease GluP